MTENNRKSRLCTSRCSREVRITWYLRARFGVKLRSAVHRTQAWGTTLGSGVFMSRKMCGIEAARQWSQLAISFCFFQLLTGCNLQRPGSVLLTLQNASHSSRTDFIPFYTSNPCQIAYKSHGYYCCERDDAPFICFGGGSELTKDLSAIDSADYEHSNRTSSYYHWYDDQAPRSIKHHFSQTRFSGWNTFWYRPRLLCLAVTWHFIWLVCIGIVCVCCRPHEVAVLRWRLFPDANRN